MGKLLVFFCELWLVELEKLNEKDKIILRKNDDYVPESLTSN